MPERKYAKPRKRNLDQQKISEFLNQLGFETKSIHQEWLHLHVFGKYEDKDAVFKLASTQATSPRTQNEFNFNEAVYLTPQSTRVNFIVPENYASGTYGKLFYFVAQRFMGEPFVRRNSTDLSIIAPRISQIAQATFELGNLSIPQYCTFAQSKKVKRQKQVSVGERLLTSSSEWASQVPKNLEPFLQVIRDSKDSLRTCLGHGDFVPRQLYDVDGKIGVIDGEHAGLRGPLYYDVAQFYLRLRNDHEGDELARKYLVDFRALLSSQDQSLFWEELKPVLIQRYIGDLWGAAKNPKKLGELQPLGEDILSNKII